MTFLTIFRPQKWHFWPFPDRFKVLQKLPKTPKTTILDLPGPSRSLQDLPGPYFSTPIQALFPVQTCSRTLPGPLQDFPGTFKNDQKWSKNDLFQTPKGQKPKIPKMTSRTKKCHFCQFLDPKTENFDFFLQKLFAIFTKTAKIDLHRHFQYFFTSRRPPRPCLLRPPQKRSPGPSLFTIFTKMTLWK
jgi:hypothetical protein